MKYNDSVYAGWRLARLKSKSIVHGRLSLVLQSLIILMVHHRDVIDSKSHNYVAQFFLLNASVVLTLLTFVFIAIQ